MVPIGSNWNFKIQAQPQYHTRCFDTKQSIKQTNFPTTRGILLFPVIFQIGHFDAIEISRHISVFALSALFAATLKFFVVSVRSLRQFSVFKVSFVFSAACKVRMVPHKEQMNEKDKIVNFVLFLCLNIYITIFTCNWRK